MRKTILKTGLILALLFAGTFLTAGKLIDTDYLRVKEPIIDLPKDTKNAHWGTGSGSQKETIDVTDPGIIPEAAAATMSENTEEQLVIEVYGNTVRINGRITVPAACASVIKEKYRSGMKVLLIDNYAGREEYIQVKSILKEQGIYPSEKRE